MVHFENCRNFFELANTVDKADREWRVSLANIVEYYKDLGFPMGEFMEHFPV